MCQLKGGIILKNGCHVSQGEDDSRTTLLEELGIADTTENAITKFVRAGLTPDKYEWWTNPDGWIFNVDQDIVPDWFDLDREKYEKEFREAVKEWCNMHVLLDKKVDELKKGFYMLKRCEVKRLCNDVQIVCDSSTVNEMCDSSTVSEMYGSSTVSRMYDRTTVSRMYNSSAVSRMYDSAMVREMYDRTTVSRMYDSAAVSEMYDSSTVSRMYDRTIARDYQNGKTYIAQHTDLEVEKRK